MRVTPVFLISFNRADMLRRTVDGVRRLAAPTAIVVRDNGSTDDATLATLATLEREGVAIDHAAPVHDADDLEHVNETISRWFGGPPTTAYAVSDADIDFSAADPRALDIYAALLDAHPAAACVGPMLTIADVPRAYPLYSRMMNRHIEQFWRHDPCLGTTPFGPVAFQPATIDTTFALHRAGAPFRRLSSGLRVYAPYEARHLDWYATTTEGIYANTSSPSIAHWNNRAETVRFRNEPLLFRSYRLVRPDPDGALAVETINL